MSARVARRLLARAARDGAHLSTLGADALQVAGNLSPALRAEISANFRPVFELVAAREDDEARVLVARASALHGWTPDDESAAQEAMDHDARAALTWLRWCASGGDARALVRNLSPTTRAARATSKRQETAR